MSVAKQQPSAGKPRRGDFLLVRRGLFEHVKRGWMDEQMYLAFQIVLDQADWDTGVWDGSSRRLREAVPAWSLSTCKRVLDRLCAGLYVHAEHNAQGVRGNYSVLVNKYERPKDAVRVRDWPTQDWREAETQDWREATEEGSLGRHAGFTDDADGVRW